MTSPSTDDSLDAELEATRLPSIRLRIGSAIVARWAKLGAREGPAAGEWLAIIALMAWPMLVIRTFLVLATTRGFRVSDARGYLSDLGVATLFAAPGCIWRSARRRALIAAAFLLLALVSLADLEHVRANGAAFDITAAALLFDKTFASGSVLGVRALWQVSLIFLPALGGSWIYSRWGGRRGRTLRLFDVGLVLLAFALFEALVPVPNDRMHWRQQHPLAENAANIWRRSVVGSIGRASAHGPLPAEYRHLRERDLSGHSSMASRSPVRNVLLVLIEGLSRGHIFAMNGARGEPGWLSTLAGFAEKHVDYTEYMALQRQTNRGEYSILCGDIPNMLVHDSEMDVYSATPPSERAECLPRFLQRHGFTTVYLQAAPITFMGKDEFLPNAGFSSVLDTKWFSKAYSTSGWGVDDRAFFEQTGELISQLQRGEQPWFLTLLTVGTHHPYLIPEEWKGRSRTGAFEDSLLYLDAVLKRFLEQLEKEHVLDDTLVLFTGDESAGYILENETAEMLSQHSVPLIAAYPGDRPQRVDERFAHSDLALSIADALGLGDASTFHGRSAFRHYAEGRRLVFGNVYLSKVGAVGPGDELLLCESGWGSCSGFRTSKDGMFAGNLMAREVERDEATLLKQAMLALDREVPTASARRVPLLTAGTVRLRPKDDQQELFFGKYHDVRRPSQARVRMQMHIEGSAVRLHHDIASMGGAQVVFDTPLLLLLPGMSLEWNYDLAVAEPVAQLEFRMAALNRSSNEAVIDVKQATVEFVEHLPGESQAPGGEAFSIAAQQFAVTLKDEARLDLMEHPDLLGRAACVQIGERGAWSLDGCSEGMPIFGPYMPLPASVTARIHFEITVERGSATSHVDIAAEHGSQVLASSRPLALVPGTQTLELGVQLSRPHSDVETRLHLSHVAGLKASIRKVWVDVEPE